MVDTTGAQFKFNGQPYQQNPCLEHNTLIDLLGPAGLSWKYYDNKPGGIWDAPNAVHHICLNNGTPIGSPCDNSLFTTNVQPTSKFFQDFSGGGPNLNPSQGQLPYCNLPSVAWIIPDGTFSDHPGLSLPQTDSHHIEGGPNWVGEIVNAVGQANCVEYGTNQSPWLETVIFVVWDDWGGWYDHVGPVGFQDNDSIDFNGQPHCFPQYQPTGSLWGCGYTYGFRVPFLVVSAYTQPGYVSGGCTVDPKNGTCYPPNGLGTANADPYRHDFGSILAFIEYNFRLGMGCINIPVGSDGSHNVTCNQGSRGNGNFPFADYFAPELQYSRSPGGQPTIPLADFFNVKAPLGFVPIRFIVNPFTNDYFKNFNGPFTDPDNDMIDNH